MVSRKYERHLLDHGNQEDEDLVPCQQFAHAVSFAKAKWNNSFVLYIPEYLCLNSYVISIISPTYLPSELINLDGLKRFGFSKYVGSFMKNERLAKNVDPFGKMYSPTAVCVVVLWGIDIGATLEILCTSVIVAWV
jgi:hypothetical protein